MGCASTTTQTDNVVAPSSNYIEVGTKPSAQNTSEVVDSKSATMDVPAKNQPVPETKIQEERITTAATEQLKHEAMKHVPEGKAFIFGQSQNQRKIVLLDCEKMQFSILSNRPQSPNPPHKYQPKEVIFQESQELLASSLFNNNSHPPYNFMFITFTSDETIFLCGGINYQFDYVSEEAFLFRVASITNEEPQARRKKGANNLVGNKFEKLPWMKEKRYSHMGAFFKMGKLSYIYVFGGRGEDQELMSSCQQYSLEEKKWRQLTPMKTPRSTGFSLIFKSKIYIFGGYTGPKKRSKTIEVYDPIKNFWESLSVKLHRGIQAGIIFSVKPNEILLLGGNMETGSLKSVIRMNLAQQTYVWDSSMKNERLLQKGVKLNDLIYVFGGDFQDSFEKYNLKDKKWKDHQLSYNQFISIEDINSYQMASETIEVPFDQSVLGKTEQNNQYERYIIFGNDNYPCILELNLSKWVLKKKVVPMALRLRCHMGVTKLMEGKYFLCGGIDSLNQKPSRASYIYYSGTNKAIEVAKMSSKKYQFAICGNSKYVYIFGGKSETGQIIRECERYCLEQQKWTLLPNLPGERTGAKALIVDSKILLFGGSDTLQTVTSIDIFDTQTNQFWNSKQSLSMPAEIKSIYLDDEPSPAVFLFSYNEVLTKYYCHYLALNIPEKDEQPAHQQKIEENFSLVREVEEKQINIKVVPYILGFAHDKKVNIITPKGLFNWQPSRDESKQHKFQNQIVINQVEMMQYPIDKFSAP